MKSLVGQGRFELRRWSQMSTDAAGTVISLIRNQQVRGSNPRASFSFSLIHKGLCPLPSGVDLSAASPGKHRVSSWSEVQGR